MKRKILFFWILSDVVILDQITKYLATRRLPFDESKYLLPFFSLTHIHNTGAAFGIGQDRNSLFIALNLLILAALWFLGKRLIDGNPLGAVGFALVAGGAVGNLIDRAARGHVVDFLDFHWRGWHWPAFNVADSAVCVGVCLILLFSPLPLPIKLPLSSDGNGDPRP